MSARAEKPSSATGLTPADVSARASAQYRRHRRDWAADPEATAVLDVPLKVPIERDVLRDVGAAIGWIESWRDAARTLPVTVQWGERRWSNVGRQQVPDRVRIEGAHNIARVAGEGDAFAALSERCSSLVASLKSTGGDHDAVVAAVRRHAGAIGALTEQDFGLLAGVVRWLAEHPASGRWVRELPIRGIHSKWIEERRSLVSALVAAVTGEVDLGLARPPRLVRMRSLEPSWTVAGLTDVSLRLDEAGALDIGSRTALIVENQQTLLALPPMPGVVALFGGGYAVDAWGPVPWLAGRRVLYWGDLDSHGFGIVHRARSHGINVETVLMDTETLLSYRDLWVAEPSPHRAALDLLSDSEHDALTALRDCGDVRLEQERIPWSHAHAALLAATNA